jgi:hypothetical protein
VLVGTSVRVTLPSLQGLVGGLVLVGTTNRVLYRMALVPMKEHTFALATFQNVFYCLAYFSLLALRYRRGVRWGRAWCPGSNGAAEPAVRMAMMHAWRPGADDSAGRRSLTRWPRC